MLWNYCWNVQTFVSTPSNMQWSVSCRVPARALKMSLRHTSTWRRIEFCRSDTNRDHFVILRSLTTCFSLCNIFCQYFYVVFLSSYKLLRELWSLTTSLRISAKFSSLTNGLAENLSQLCRIFDCANLSLLFQTPAILVCTLSSSPLCFLKNLVLSSLPEYLRLVTNLWCFWRYLLFTWLVFPVTLWHNMTRCSTTALSNWVSN